jgi:hypothetical protein
MKKLLIFAALAASAFAGDEAPTWLREYSTAKTPSYESRVPAVVLLDEEAVTVEEGGRVVTTNRRAIKILNKEGRREAIERKIYATSAGKVRDMHAWLIRPSGEVKKYGKNEVMDVALSQEYLYDESRARVVNASSDADPGAVFGSEVFRAFRSPCPPAGVRKAWYSMGSRPFSNPVPRTPGRLATCRSSRPSRPVRPSMPWHRA